MREDSANWEGGDDWIRTKFHTYLLNMLAAAKNFETGSTKKMIKKDDVEDNNIKEHIDERELPEDEFNDEFLKAWKSKHNYRVWSCTSHADFVDISPRQIISVYHF